ncbi:MAG: SDR family NAD(P)-dependent oxidoreductase, partial [Rhodospirillaceae bacterium]
TGAAAGLGRAHAMALASRGARVVVNDLEAGAAEAVADEIRAAGGEAMAAACSVTDPAGVGVTAEQALGRWGRIDILISNAGLLRDRSFSKMSLEDFRLVVDVHLMGAVICCKAVWPAMQAQKYGRIVLTTSASGLYGNFGQSNYGAAKMALVGLMQTLSIEGANNNIRVNCIAPVAATKMTEGVIPPERLARIPPEAVSHGLLALVAETAPTRVILCAGAGAYERAHVTLTQGIYLDARENVPEQVAERLDAISDRSGETVPEHGAAQGMLELAKAMQPGDQRT